MLLADLLDDTGLRLHDLKSFEASICKALYRSCVKLFNLLLAEEMEGSY